MYVNKQQGRMREKEREGERLLDQKPAAASLLNPKKKEKKMSLF